MTKTAQNVPEKTVQTAVPSPQPTKWAMKRKRELVIRALEFVGAIFLVAGWNDAVLAVSALILGFKLAEFMGQEE